MTSAVRHVARAAGAASVVAALAGLGMPAIAAAVCLAVLLLAAACWVIASRDRSDHTARIILGLRGDARCLSDATQAAHAPSPPPAPPLARQCGGPWHFGHGRARHGSEHLRRRTDR